MKKYLFVFSLIAFLIVGLLIGYALFKPTPINQEVNSLVIYNKLQNQGFLVTQDYISEQKVTIDNSSGQWLSDFLWQQKIEASGIMKVSLGVDLQKLQPADIQLNDKIVVNLPAIEVQSVEVLWNILLQNSQGIMKRLFNNDDGYNQAYSQLKEQAKQAAMSTEITQQAQTATRLEIGRLLKLIDEEKEVIINFK